jgi:molybdate transport system substrate-binding protein
MLKPPAMLSDRAIRGRLVAVALMAFAARADAQEIRVMTSGAFTAALTELTPIFERDSGARIVAVYGGSMGSAPTTIPNRLARGEAADVVILASSSLNELVERGLVASGTLVDLVRSPIGLAVRAGAPKPDIGSLQALERALLAAKSIAYSSSASGVYLSTELFPKLGLADRIAAKSRMIETEPVGAVVARGDAEIGFQQVSELLPVKGIEIVGPLPEGAQRLTVFSAGIASNASQAALARRLIVFLSSPAVAEVIRRTGLDPIGTPLREVVLERGPCPWPVPFANDCATIRVPQVTRGGAVR